MSFIFINAQSMKRKKKKEEKEERTRKEEVNSTNNLLIKLNPDPVPYLSCNHSR